jgi:predicted DNA-binding protein
MKNEHRFNIRTTREEKERLREVAAMTGISQSDIIREAINKEVAKLNAKLQQGKQIAMGIVTK